MDLTKLGDLHEKGEVGRERLGGRGLGEEIWGG